MSPRPAHAEVICVAKPGARIAAVTASGKSVVIAHVTFRPADTESKKRLEVDILTSLTASTATLVGRMLAGEP